MEKTNLKNWLVVSVFLLGLSGSVWATGTYEDGDGSEGDPFQINTAEQMNTIGLHSEDWDKHFKLVADIDLGVYTGTQYNVIGSYPGFTGTFDGNGHKISNFTYHSPGANFIGLFGYVDNNGEIKNLGLISPNVDVVDESDLVDSGLSIGALVETCYSGTISGCYVEGGSVSANKFLGGLVGYNVYGTIIDCYTTCTVFAANSDVGGLVGVNLDYGTIISCHSSSNVTAEEYYSNAGGLVGTNFGHILNCYATGTVTGSEFITGGLVGGNAWPTSLISRCYATGNVFGEEGVGGLAGLNNSGLILDCYATGRVQGSGFLGGLIGYAHRIPGEDPAEVSRCYSTSEVSGAYEVGGLIGVRVGTTVTGCFWDTDRSGRSDGVGDGSSSGITGKTTAEMKGQNMFVQAGWDFVEQVTHDPGEVWTMCRWADYPRFAWQVSVADSVYYVDGPNGDDNNDGLSLETAFATIHKALDTAWHGNTIIVLPGRYHENINFGAKRLTLRSFDPNHPDETIIDGNDLDSVVTFVGSENANCRLTGFTITGGNTAGNGGGIQGNFTRAIIDNCIIKNNVSQNRGGGVSRCDGVLDRCIIAGNSAANRGGGLLDSDCAMTNCLIYDNSVGYLDGSTEGYGGGLYGCSGDITNCTIAFNAANGRAGGLDGCNGTIANCIVWGNELEQLLNCSEPTYSCIQDWYGGGIGNINNNPLLGDPANEDYHLQPGSPCIDAGNNGAVPVEIDRDFDGNARFADDPNVPDTGSGTEPIVDMGAYEGSYILYADLYVDDDAVGANDGTSWANGFNYLQDALSAARYGAQIFVAEGTYMPDETTTNPNGSGDREATFKLKNGVALYGGFPSGGGTWAERDPNLYETILDGDLDGDDDVFVEPGPGGGWQGENCADATMIYEGETPFDTTGSTTDGPGDCEANQDIWYVYTPEWTGYLKVDLCDSNFGPYVAIYEGLACPPTELVLCASDFCNSRVSILVSEGTSYLIRIGADGDYTGTGIITLSRDLRGENSYHVITAWDVGESCILDGFTVTGGNANSNESPHFLGGGMHNERCQARISNCTFRANYGVAGGGMVNDESFATVENCLFIENVAEVGGGMDNRELSGPTVTNCVFIDNIAEWSGGGMRNGSSITVLSNCIFRGNSAIYNGGGIDDSTSTLDNCTFSNNSAGRKGGAVYAAFSNSTLTNCTFTGNSSGRRGGAVSCDYGSIPILTNCTFTANYAANYGGGICNQDNGHPTLTNCILWDNAAQTGSQIYDIDETSAPTVSYCDVQGGWPGEGNIDADPRFVDPNGADGVIGTEDDDLHLLGDSACIDAGDNSVVDPNSTDLDGNPRILDGDNDGEAVVDMGAYEAVVPAMVEVAMKFTPQALNPGSQGKWVKAHLVLAEGFGVDDVDADTPAEIEQLGIESEYMNVFINEEGLVEIEAAFRRGDFCAAIDYGPGEVTVIGRLTSGQYFCGSDTIRIINNKLGYVGALASYWLQADCGPPDWCGGLDVDQDSVVDWLDFAMSDGCCIEFSKE